MGKTYYKVVSNGVTIEWTDRRSQADHAYSQSVKQKQLFRVHPDGRATLIQQQTI